MSESKQDAPVSLIVTDDNRIARMISNQLGYNPHKRGKSSPYHAFYYKVPTKEKNYLIISTNGHLQLFQNSSIYKWSGIDPRKIIEDSNSVIPVLNSFNKKNYHSISKILQTTSIAECIVVITPDINSLTIALKEFGNLLKKSHPDLELRKVILFSLHPRYILDRLNHAELFSFEDILLAEIEYFRSYLDALISFSITQEITYTIKQCIDAGGRKFDELRDILKKDLKERRNIIIPMSRAQALILTLVKERNNLVDQVLDARKYELLAKVVIDNENVMDVKVNEKEFSDHARASQVLEELKDVKHGRIDTINSHEKRVKPHPLFNITSIIEEVLDVLGFPTSYTYKILVDLYNARLITYPNPENLDNKDFSIDHESILEKIMELDDIECPEKQLLASMNEYPDFNVVIQSNSILPILIVPRSHRFFKGKQNYWKVYEILVKRYLLQYLKPAKVLKTDYTLCLDNGKELSITLTKIIEDGFYRAQKPESGGYVTGDLNMFTSVEFEEFFIKKIGNGLTYYTNASLLKEIEALDLGNTVSYLMMIDKLVDNDYIRVVNKHLKLTRRGEIITGFLSETFDFLGSVEFSRFFMDKLHELINVEAFNALEGKMEETRSEILGSYLEKFDVSREKTKIFLASAGIEVTPQEIDSRHDQKSRFSSSSKNRIFCECGSPMKIIDTKNNKRFLACENRVECGKTAYLPNEGRIKIVGKKCTLCDNNVMKIESKNKGTYYYCPICWTKSMQEPGLNAGFCFACDELDGCWIDSDEEFIEMKDALCRYGKSFQKCPRCKNYDLVQYVNEKDPDDKARLICQNPLCTFHIFIPAPFVGKIEKTSKNCLICPMNAVLFKKSEDKTYHVCLNCYNAYLEDKRKEIGFCIGCRYYPACFKEELHELDEKLSLKESVLRKMEDPRFL